MGENYALFLFGKGEFEKRGKKVELTDEVTSQTVPS